MCLFEFGSVFASFSGCCWSSDVAITFWPLHLRPSIQLHTVSMATASHSGPLTSASVLVWVVWLQCKLSESFDTHEPNNFSSYPFCLYNTRLMDYLKVLVMSWILCTIYFNWKTVLFCTYCSSQTDSAFSFPSDAEAKSYSEAKLKNPMKYSSKSGGNVNQCLKKGPHGLDGGVEKYLQKEENVERRKVATSREGGMEPIQTVGT